MNPRELLNKQKVLDTLIFQNANLKEYPFRKVKLALLVELGELANEVQSFKYWKKNKDIKRSKIHEEWADCLHFSLSLENELHQTSDIFLDDTKLFETVFSYSELDTDVDKAFEIAFKRVNEEDSILITIIGLGLCIDINLDEMVRAYNSKYEENIKRQNNEY